jgi:hypothetical protein
MTRFVFTIDSENDLTGMTIGILLRKAAHEVSKSELREPDSGISKVLPARGADCQWTWSSLSTDAR